MADLEIPFSNVPVAPPNAIFHLMAKYKEDPHPDKMNLSVGAFRNDEGQPIVLDTVQKAEADIAERIKTGKLTHEYLGIGGHKGFVQAALKLVLGDNSPSLNDKRASGVQAISGTGSLRVAAEFLSKYNRSRNVLLSNPTWANHGPIFGDAGLKCNEYRYYDSQSNALDIEGMLQDFESAEEGTVVVLHACAHNPTGIDPTKEQWQHILDVCKRRKLVPVFDTAYQGFASGDLDEDAYAVRLFDASDVQFFICQSFSKNFGLYNERAGCCHFVAATSEVAQAVTSQLEVIIRPMWSNPPAHGARTVHTILTDPSRFKAWKKEVRMMADRILAMRKALHEELTALDTTRNWNHLLNQTGMFSYTGLTVDQCRHLTSKYHIYLLQSGRINMCGIPKDRVSYLADAIYDAVTTCQ